MKARVIVAYALFGALAGVVEATFTTFLPRPFLDIRLILPLLVGGVLLQRTERAMIFGLSAGVFLDVFSVGPSTFASARYLSILLCVALIARTVITNQSMYAAFALMCVARLLEWMWLLIVSLALRLTSLQFVFVTPTFHDAWQTLVWDELFLAACFVVGNFVLRRFMAPKPFGARI